MEDDYPEEGNHGLTDEGLDSSWLAGTSEYSATGGGSQPLHSPRLRGRVDREEQRDSTPDSVEELYRASLCRLTEDDHSSFDAEEQWEEGPLHLDREH
jgi:hypothetical protein